MKKIAKYLVIALMFVLVTGCGGKKITCTYSESNSYEGKLYKKTVREYGDNGIGIVKYTEYREQTYNKRYLTYLQTSYKKTISDVYKSAQDDCDDYKSVSFVSCKAKLKGRKVSQTITYNFKGLTKDSLEKLYNDNAISYSIYSKAKKALEATYDKDLLDAKDPSNEMTCK